jgi:hypothetical protein
MKRVQVCSPEDKTEAVKRGRSDSVKAGGKQEGKNLLRLIDDSAGQT